MLLLRMGKLKEALSRGCTFSSRLPWGELKASWGHVLMLQLLQSKSIGKGRGPQTWSRVHLKLQGGHIRDLVDFICETGKLITSQSWRILRSTQSARRPADGQLLCPRTPFSSEFVDHERHFERHLEGASETAAISLGVGTSIQGTWCHCSPCMLSPICWLTWLVWGSTWARWISSFSLLHPRARYVFSSRMKNISFTCRTSSSSKVGSHGGCVWDTDVGSCPPFADSNYPCGSILSSFPLFTAISFSCLLALRPSGFGTKHKSNSLHVLFNQLPQLSRAQTPW